MPVNFETSPEDTKLIADISERAHAEMRCDGLEAMMDISAVHNICPLNLSALLLAKSFDFVHDVGGIHRHLNRITGELMNGFVPRYALRDVTAQSTE